MNLALGLLVSKFPQQVHILVIRLDQFGKPDNQHWGLKQGNPLNIEFRSILRLSISSESWVLSQSIANIRTNKHKLTANLASSSASNFLSCLGSASHTWQLPPGGKLFHPAARKLPVMWMSQSTWSKSHLPIVTCSFASETKGLGPPFGPQSIQIRDQIHRSSPPDGSSKMVAQSDGLLRCIGASDPRSVPFGSIRSHLYFFLFSWLLGLATDQGPRS